MPFIDTSSLVVRPSADLLPAELLLLGFSDAIADLNRSYVAIANTATLREDTFQLRERNLQE